MRFLLFFTEARFVGGSSEPDDFCSTAFDSASGRFLVKKSTTAALICWTNPLRSKRGGDLQSIGGNNGVSAPRGGRNEKWPALSIR